MQRETGIEEIKRRAREEWGLKIGPKSNQFDQERVLDTLINKTVQMTEERIVGIVEGYGESMSKLHSEMIGKAHEDSKMMLAFDMHSRLIAVKHIKSLITG